MNLDRLTTWISGPRSKFKVGDSVQLEGGEYLMVVIEVASDRKMAEPLIHCEWYDRDSRSIRKNLFPEGTLKPFDWYHPGK